MEQGEESEAVYYITEEEISSFEVNEKNEQIIVLKEGCSILVHDEKSEAHEENHAAEREGDNTANESLENSAAKPVDGKHVTTETANERDSVIENEMGATVEQKCSVSEPNDNTVMEQDSCNAALETRSADGGNVSSAQGGVFFMVPNGSCNAAMATSYPYSSNVPSAQSGVVFMVPKDSCSTAMTTNYPCSGGMSSAVGGLVYMVPSDSCNAAMVTSYPYNEKAPSVPGGEVSMFPDDECNAVTRDASTEVEIDNLTCEYCLRQFNNPSNRRRHVRNIHECEEKPQLCSVVTNKVISLDGTVTEVKLVPGGNDSVMEHEKSLVVEQDENHSSAMEISGEASTHEGEIVPIGPDGVAIDDKTCQYCLKRFHQPYNKRRHLQNVHGIEQEYSLVKKRKLASTDNTATEGNSVSMVSDGNDSVIEHETNSVVEQSVLEHNDSAVMEEDENFNSTVEVSSAGDGDTSTAEGEVVSIETDGVAIDKKTCQYCLQHFTRLCNKRKHLKNVHGIEEKECFVMNEKKGSSISNAVTQDELVSMVTNEDVIVDILTDTAAMQGELVPMVPEGAEIDSRICRYCLKAFSNSSNKMNHIRQVHKIKKKHSIGTYIKCIECDINFNSAQKLRNHLALVHERNMDVQELHFPNMSAFKKWKHDIERKELTSFTLRHGARKLKNGLKYFYVCHRSGKYSSRVTGPRQRMLKTPGTCKLGIVCTAAIYCEECPDSVIVRYCPHHYGHGKETSFVQLSVEEQAAIQDNVSKGIPFENLLDDIKDNQSSADHFQLYLLKKRDIRFINNAYAAEEYNQGLSDAESVDQWVRLCCQMEDSPILFYRQEEIGGSEEDFLLIIMTEFQKQILMSSAKQVVCVDSLYRRKGGRFYLTVLFIMDEYDIAFPVAFCISNKVDKTIIWQFFASIKESTGPLSCDYFMSDSENFYYDAWQEVMEDNSKWIWSMWFVDNRIRVQLRVFRGNIVKRAEAYKTMRMLLECQNKNVFDSMFKNYIDSLQSDPQSKNLGNFILQKYGANAEMWAYCYRKDIKLSTNIHLEVMHRTFRYCCREGRKKRLDKFIFVIMKLVRYKMLDRLANMLDDEKTELAIEAINMCHHVGLEIPSEHISSLSDKIWLIRSDEEEQSVYVMREFETCPEHCNLRCAECDICVHMYSCSCLHSMINANLCQHIHAVVWKFLTPHFSPPASPMHEDPEERENIDVSVIPDTCPELLDSVLKRTHDLYKKVRGNKCGLSKDSLSAIMKRLNECFDICNGKEFKEPVVTDSPPKDPQNPVYVVNPYVKKDVPQPFIYPNNFPTILPNNTKPLSQYVLLLPNNSTNNILQNTMR